MKLTQGNRNRQNLWSQQFCTEIVIIQLSLLSHKCKKEAIQPVSLWKICINAWVLNYWGRISIEVYEFNAVAMQSLRFSLQPLSAATSAPGISTDRLRKACLNQQFSVIIPLLSCLTPCEGVTQASLCLLDGFGQIFSHTLWSADVTASCWAGNKGHNSTQGSRKFTGKELKLWTHHFQTQSGWLNCSC